MEHRCANDSVCVEGNITTWRVYLAVLQSVPRSLCDRSPVVDSGRSRPHR